VATYEIQSNELHGIGVKWDPINPHRVASAISKEIKAFDISFLLSHVIGSVTAVPASGMNGVTERWHSIPVWNP